MKIIFLDIDGVLNNIRSMKEGDWVNALDHENWDRTSLATLQKVINASGAVIIISSTWRIHQPGEVWWNEQFALAGLNAQCVGVTGRVDNGFRGAEVAEIVDILQPESYVILDDDQDFYDYQPFVWIDPEEGLTDDYVESILKLLK
jgi:hypothetical protein